MMQLECEGRLSSSNATEADIRQAFLDDDGRGEFIILSEADQFYIQAANEGDEPFTLEYREGDDSRHFQSVRDVLKPEVEAAFLKYLKRDASWKNDFEWEKLDFET